MRDGLYAVLWQGFTAGFVMKNGQVVQCAPVLRKRLDYWMTKAVWISE